MTLPGRRRRKGHLGKRYRQNIKPPVALRALDRSFVRALERDDDREGPR